MINGCNLKWFVERTKFFLGVIMSHLAKFFLARNKNLELFVFKNTFYHYKCKKLQYAPKNQKLDNRLVTRCCTGSKRALEIKIWLTVCVFRDSHICVDTSNPNAYWKKLLQDHATVQVNFDVEILVLAAGVGAGTGVGEGAGERIINNTTQYSSQGK